MEMIDPARDRDRVNPVAGAVDVIDLCWSDGRQTGLVRVEFDIVEAVTTAAVVIAVEDRRPVAVVSTDLPVPDRMELRGPGIWLELICETPLDHWTVGLEAFGVTVEPHEIISVDTRGDLTPIGLDLDLDTVDLEPLVAGDGFSIAVRVHGEVLVGTESHEIDCRGVRRRGGPHLTVDESHAEIRDRLRLRHE